MQIDDASLRTLAAKAVLDGLTEENRNQLLQSAISGLFQEGSDYRDKRTKLQIAFDSALRYSVDTIITQMLQEPEHQARIRDAITVAIEKMLTQISDDGTAPILTKVLCDAFEKGLTKRDY